MKPQKEINGIVFFPVPEFSDVSAVFGASESAFFDRRKLPEVPERFEKMANDLFFSGEKPPEFSSKVDRKKAATAIRAWLGSFAPAHEAKVATVAYALWLWTNDKALEA